MAFRKQWIAPTLMGILVLVVGLVMFFIAWAEADAIHPAKWASTAFHVLSFPLLAITPQQISNTYFWELGFANIFLWAILATFLSWRWLDREEQHK